MQQKRSSTFAARSAVGVGVAGDNTAATKAVPAKSKMKVATLRWHPDMALDSHSVSKMVKVVQTKAIERAGILTVETLQSSPLVKFP
jgi:hypothetical protein